VTHDAPQPESGERATGGSPLAVSLIIPALDEAANIERAVTQALLAEPDEVIVADGGSDDGTPQFAEQAGAMVIESPRGRAKQQNAGAAAARGDVFLFVHADNYLAADALRQVRVALANPKILYGAFRQRIEVEGARYRALEWGNAQRVRIFGAPYGDQGIFVRRETFAQLGGFPDVPIMEDLLLMRQARKLARPLLLEGPIFVSPRRWQEYGVIRQTVRNTLLRTGLAVGMSPEMLARWYPSHTASRRSTLRRAAKNH